MVLAGPEQASDPISAPTTQEFTCVILYTTEIVAKI